MQDVKYTTTKRYGRYFYPVKPKEQKMALVFWIQSKKRTNNKFFNKVGIHIDNLIGNYDNLILIGDFNSEMEEEQ